MALDYPTPDESLPLAYFFLSLLSAGAILMTVLLLVVILSPRVHRHPTWLNFCVTWIVFPVSYILLYISGKPYASPPPFALCLTQASLIYAAPVLSGAAAFSLILRIWSDQRAATAPEIVQPKRCWTIGLVCMPWVFFVGVITEVLVIGLRSPSQVQRTGNFSYCVIKTGIPGHISAFLIAAILLMSFLAQFAVARSFVKHSRQVEKDYRASFPTDVMIRLAVFTLVVLCTVGIVMTFSKPDMNRNIVDGTISPLPLIIFVIFGIQKDIVNVMLMRKRPRQEAALTASDFSSVADIT